MTDFNDPEKQDRLQSYLNIHLKKDEQSLSLNRQVETLHKRKRNKWIQFAINIAAILFFGYSFYFQITDLSQIFFLIIVAVFVINIGLIFYQKSQIDELVDYLQWKEKHES